MTAPLPAEPPPPQASPGETYLAECRTLVLAEIQRIVRARAADEDAYRLMLDYPLRRAKGLRPALCIAVCRALGGDLAPVLPSAAVIEIYHNAFLIHDDIEDGSLERRGAPALHHTHGIPTAINCGDGLLALTLAPLLANTELLGLGRALRVLEEYARAVTESFEGQTRELAWIQQGSWDLTDDDYEQMVLRKTCSYSFVAPGLVGAIVAGASPAAERALAPFLRSLGVAFQIQDDLLNLEEGRDAYGKELAGDLWEGKRTLMLLHALRSSPEPDRARALEILRKPRPAQVSSLDPRRRLLADLESAGILDAPTRAAATAYLEQHTSPAEKTAEEVQFLHSLLVSHSSIPPARAVCARHAAAAEQAFQRLTPHIPDSPHTRFLAWLKDYVVRREW
ncbi:MAG: polyprenyl synthetase family protein [Polyangiaceae bacterium]